MGIFFGLYLIASFILMVVFKDMPDLTTLNAATVTSAQIAQYKWMQLISATLTFLLPAFIFNYLSSPKPFQYGGFSQKSYPALFILTILLLLSSLPVVGVLGNWNEQLTFGNWQSSIKKLEEAYSNAMTIILKMNGPGDLLINLFLMALLPAVAEEFFFRGTLQSVLLRWWKRPVAAVIGSALFFALMHGTFYKIIPILAMGILLGTLFMVTKNLWYSIFFHFLFNGLQIVLLYISQQRAIPGFDSSKQEILFPVWGGAIGLLAIAVILVFMQKEKNRWVSRPENS